ncbi:MAG: hypothetical protein U9Q40_07540 [Campylobacterota bacterium]|nr:hypothetical protein [Campylobacterota bacterium]
MAGTISFFVTLFLYVSRGMQELSSEVFVALTQIFLFWFALIWSLTLLVALFRSLKYIFNSCYDGYRLELLSCPSENSGESEVIKTIGYGDLVKVFRRWLMLIIWLVGAQMIVAVAFTKLLSFESAIFEWFNIYILYLFVLVAGYFSLMLLGSRCKKVKVTKC